MCVNKPSPSLLGDSEVKNFWVAFGPQALEGEVQQNWNRMVLWESDLCVLSSFVFFVGGVRETCGF